MKIFITLLVILPLVVESLRYAAPPRRRRPNSQRPTRPPVRTRATRPPPTRDPWPTEPARETEDPWPLETRDPWPANPNEWTTRQPANPTDRTTDQWPADTTSRRTTPARTTTPFFTTTPTPTGRDFCQTLIADGDCFNFYTCFLNTQQACEFEALPLTLDTLIRYCVTSEGVQDDNGFDRVGNRYIAEYRKCTQQRLLPVIGSDSCDEIDFEAEKILYTDDAIWDCLYQNHTLCDVINNDDNSVALGDIFTGTDSLSFSVYQHLMRRVQNHCGNRAGRAFARDYGRTFLSNMQSSMMSGMMMMGGNGGD